MAAGVWFAVGAIAAGGLWLTAICVRRHVVLGGVAEIAGLAFVAFSSSRGVSGYAAHVALGLALVLLLVGAVLLGLGGVLQRVLDDPPGSPGT
jgi:hypothetical protein